MSTIKNLTPHPVNILDQYHKTIEIIQPRRAERCLDCNSILHPEHSNEGECPACGGRTHITIWPARLSVKTVEANPIVIHYDCRGGIDEHEHNVYCGCYNGTGWDIKIPTTRTVFGRPVGLPEPKTDVWLIVSQLVKSALPDRTDLLVPTDIVRDANGSIIGCRSLGR